jgi:tRNA-specific 2-thiouridylase
VDALAFEHHLTSPQGLDHHPPRAQTITRGGGACCDELTFSLELSGNGAIADAGFSAHGCGATTAAGSAAVTLARGRPVLDVARIGAREIAAELGGLSPGKLHAAELAADALARALGAALTAAGAPALSAPAGRTRTLVAMSGGVDSALAAQLAAGDGEAVAVTLELWADREHDEERSCCSASAVAQARALAHGMDLPHLTLDLREPFRAGVVEPFIAGYVAGETPNPCVRCNGHVRLDALLELADRVGAATLVTGHYARVAESGDPAGPLLRAAADPAKDQSYMLAALSPESLARMRFPLGELTKPQVRAQARAAGLSVAGKPDSQDLCFLAGTDRARFLARHGAVSARIGQLVDEAGRTVGEHDGQHRFTVGQRRGLGVAHGEPLYVLEKDAATNRVLVGPRRSLERTEVALRDVALHRPGARVDAVKLRYRSRPLAAVLAGDRAPGHHERLEVRLAEPALAVAPGQLACLLDGELIVGHGTIDRG